ncbi:ATP-dependent Clp protease proteolytic subunit, partial [Pseudomonas aeruginosa]
MIHEPLGGVQGQAADIEIHAKEILFAKGRLKQLLLPDTGHHLAVTARDADRDPINIGDEAVKYGMFDKVMTKHDLAV